MLDMDETATSNQKETNVAEHVKDFKLMLKQVCIIRLYTNKKQRLTGLCTAVSNVSSNRCKSDCRSRGHKFDPGPVPYFC